MGKAKLIFETNDIEKASSQMLRNIDRAVVASAFSIRDDARRLFANSASIYKTHTSSYKDLAQGIMIGKLRSSQIKIHSLTSNGHLYKTKFFVGGTQYRKQTKIKNKTLSKPYQKGYIKPNETIEKAMDGADTTLSNYIKNAMEE